MIQRSALGGLLCWLLCTTAAAAPGRKASAPIVELSLVVLDAEPAGAAVRKDDQGDVITMLPPERGAFVASSMDCGPAGLGPCRPGWPMAVLTTFDGLKRFISGLAPETSLEWNVSCMGPLPREHPLSGSGASDEIAAFAARHRVKFVIHKAG